MNNNYTPPGSHNGPHMSPAVYGDYVNSYSVPPVQRHYQQQQQQQHQHNMPSETTHIDHSYSNQHYGQYSMPSPPPTAFNSSAPVNEAGYSAPLTRYLPSTGATNATKPAYQQVQYSSATNDVLFWHSQHQSHHVQSMDHQREIQRQEFLQRQDLQRQAELQRHELQRQDYQRHEYKKDYQRQHYPVQDEYIQYSYVPAGPYSTVNKQLALHQSLGPQPTPYANRYQTVVASVNDPRSNAASSRQKHYPEKLVVTDPEGQNPPPNVVPKMTTTLWEDEGTLCYQVEVRGVSIARRNDNEMINGTKLLNVTGITRGRRDGILKAEKVRHVVKCGSMHLKGVWIPYERALALANQEHITDLLYPLFVKEIRSVIYEKDYCRAHDMLAAAKQNKRKFGEETEKTPSEPDKLRETLPRAKTPKRNASSDVKQESVEIKKEVPLRLYKSPRSSGIHSIITRTTLPSPPMIHHDRRPFTPRNISFPTPQNNSNGGQTLPPVSSTGIGQTNDFSAVVTSSADSPQVNQNFGHGIINKGLAILNHPDPQVSGNSMPLVHQNPH